MSKNMTRLFVYGTLRVGGGAEHFFEQENGDRLIDTGIPVSAKWAMKSINGAFPGIVETNETNTIIGDLWEVSENTMEHLDRYEGVPHLYIRKTMNLRGRPTEVYIFNEDHTNFDVVESGDWLDER